MGIERCDFVNFGHAHAHFFSQSAQVRRRKMPEFILNKMQMLDQQIGASRFIRQ
jgi:hypothetical protein